MISSTPQPFDLLTSPIQGRTLLEASAGTGKTFSVTKIALRYIFQQGLPIEKILLVTFTNLATAELKSALVDELYALEAFLQQLSAGDYVLSPTGLADFAAQNTLEGNDVILHGFLQQLSTDALAQVPERLRLALLTSDSSAVMTLHGLAERLVQEQSFSIGASLAQQALLDTEVYKKRTIEDFCRLHYRDLPQFTIPKISKAHLESLLNQSLNNPYMAIPSLRNLEDFPAKFTPEHDAQNLISLTEKNLRQWRDSDQCLLDAEQKAREIWRQHWQNWRVEFPLLLRYIIETNKTEKDWFAAKLINTLLDPTQKNSIVDTLERVTAICDSDAAFDALPDFCVPTKTLPLGSRDFPTIFSSSLFQTWLKKKAKTLFQPTALMQELDNVVEALLAYQLAKSRLYQDGYAYARRWLLWRYEDLLSKDYCRDVSSAFGVLEQALQSDGGEHLATTIRTCYPVAIVDEFQDTDPLQFAILDKIYPDIETHDLIMVGDPKQSIYRFRGADIEAYLSVVKQNRYYYQLTTNYRSDAKVVEGVNAIFRERETSNLAAAPTNALSFRVPGLYFSPVKSNHGQRLSVERAESTEDNAPIEIYLHQGSDNQSVRNPDNWLSLMTAQLSELLSSGQIEGRAIGLQDIAVLCHGNQDAANTYQFLSQQGFACVLHSDSTVFEVPLGKAVLSVLSTLLEPNTASLSRALLSHLFGFSAGEIQQQKAQSDWSEIVAFWHEVAEKWVYRGISQAMVMLDVRYGIIERWVSRGQLRDVADYEQILELLHLYEQKHRTTPELLVQWLSEMVSGKSPEEIDDDIRESELYQRRLDTDRAAITIITIHKSKGLEYPIVFLPFMYKFSSPQARGLEALHATLTHEPSVPSGARVCLPDLQAIHLEPKDVDIYKTQRAAELLGERLRMLYVALTRASMRIILYDDVSKAASTANFNRPMYTLLSRHIDPPSDAKAVDIQAHYRAAYQQLAEDFPAQISCRSIDVNAIGKATTYQARALDNITLVEAKTFSRWLKPTWLSTSFSALKSNAERVSPRVMTAELGEQVAPELENKLAETETETSLDDNMIKAVPNIMMPYRFAFPAGPTYGTLLHNIFESVDVAQLAAKTPQTTATIEQLILQANLPQPIEVAPLMDWLGAIATKKILTTEQTAYALRDTEVRKLPEAEFVFKVTDDGLSKLLEAAQGLGETFPSLKAWLSQHELSLPQRTETGYLKGFIDLTYTAEGCYGVLDYKSNHLGDEDARYHPEALAETMVETGYWLQWVIYSIALHRWLKQRLAHYDYAQHHLGGMFVFLRGIHTSSDVAQGRFYAKLPTEMINQLDETLSGE